MVQGGYTKEMDRIIASLEGRPRLLLHACCAPCSSAVLELLDRHFELTIFYYNPNIAPDEEYHRREQELECFLEQAGYPHITLIEPEYDPAEFYAAAKGL